jgi:hypothetical protein
LAWRPEPHQGEFLESAAPVGSFVGCRDGRELRIELVRSSQIARGIWPPDWRGWINLAPDTAIVARDTDIPPLLIWSVVLCDARQEEQFAHAVEWLREAAHKRKIKALIFRVGGVAPTLGDERVMVRPIERPIDIPMEMLREVDRLVVGSGAQS